MPDSATDNLYDIRPLVPLIEAGYQLLTPNLRLARRITTVWDERQLQAGQQVWLPLKVSPLESWLRARRDLAVEQGLLPPAVVIDEGQALEIWQQVITRHQRSHGQYSLLRPPAAAKLAHQARETMYRWQVEKSSHAVRQSFSLDADCATFLAWLDLFDERLVQDNRVSPAEALFDLATIVNGLPTEKVALLDFDDIPPLYNTLVQQACGQPEVLDYKPQSGRCTARGFADKRAELQGAAFWAATLSREAPGETVAIVLPDMSSDKPVLEYFLRREFDCLYHDYQALPVNFSAGTPFDQMPLVRDAMAALSLSGQRISVGAVVAMLQSPYLELGDAHGPATIDLITRLHNNGREEIETGELRYLANREGSDGSALGGKLLELTQMRGLKERHVSSRWVPLIQDVLAGFGWPGTRILDSREYQQVEMWFRLLEKVSGYDAVMGPVSFAEMLQLLSRCAGREVFQPQTTDTDIQVLGILEGAGLVFDHLWICGLQGNSWPAPVRPSPMIPLAMQRELQMPHATAEREWSFASALMRRYCHSSADVNASYCIQLDGVPELPSALLSDFSREDPVTDEHGVGSAWLKQRASSALAEQDDGKAPAVTELEAATLRGGSALVEDQSQCPFRAFSKHRLRTRPLGDFSVGLSSADRGSLLHSALFALWGTLETSDNLHSADAQQLQQLVNEAANSALEAMSVGQRSGCGVSYLELERSRLSALLLEWLEVEKSRSEFRVLAREQRVELDMSPLRIKLQVDRIDQLPDGSQLIIDYKSGRCSVSDWAGDRPARPQLLLYGLAAAADPGLELSGLAFAQVRPRDSAYHGAGRQAYAPGIRTDLAKLSNGDEDMDWSDLNQSWQQKLETLVRQFVAGDAAVDRLSPNSCTYCGLQPLCRVGDEQEPQE